MRQAQQNRRGRGRNNNNRKSQNSLTRSFESNGPDVKIRGTPSHIAEKYVTMARDALSTGDPVLAENYLQHAEHYNRIILTHREQQTSHQSDAASSGQGGGRSRNAQEQPEDSRQPEPRQSDTRQSDTRQSDTRQSETWAGDAPEASAPRGSEPQPTVEAGDKPAGEREERRPRRTPRRDRSADGDRERSAGNGEQPSGGRTAGRGRRTRYAQSDDQPEFLKRPVRRPRAQPDEADEAPQPVAQSDEIAE